MKNDEPILKIVDNAPFFASVKGLLDEGREVEFTVTGRSMYPLITNRRDSVIVEKAVPKDLRLRDIVLFAPLPDVYVLHRIIKLTENGFVTAGDGNLFVDGFFPNEALVARVNAVVRRGRKIPVTSKLYRLYSAIWVKLFPIRKPLFRISEFFYKVKQSLRKKRAK